MCATTSARLAIRFRDPTSGQFHAATDVGVPALTDLPRLVEAAEHLEGDKEADAELRELLRVGSSLGGARPADFRRPADLE